MVFFLIVNSFIIKIVGQVVEVHYTLYNFTKKNNPKLNIKHINISIELYYFVNYLHLKQLFSLN